MIVERPALMKMLFGDAQIADTELDILVRAGWLEELPDPDRGVFDAAGGAFVVRKQDEILALAPLSQLATGVLGLAAGLNLWPYVVGAGVIQLAFVWLRLRDERAFVSLFEAHVLRELIVHKREGRTVDEIVAALHAAHEPVSHEEVQTALDRCLTLHKLDGESVAVVRVEAGRWFPLRI